MELSENDEDVEPSENPYVIDKSETHENPYVIEKSDKSESAHDSGIQPDKCSVISDFSTSDSGINLVNTTSIQSISDTSKLNPRFLRHNARPLSLDLCYTDSYSKLSVESMSSTVLPAFKSNTLPLPPKSKKMIPPPRPIGPKPAKFKAQSVESKLSQVTSLKSETAVDNVDSKLSMEITPIPETTKNDFEAALDSLETMQISKSILDEVLVNITHKKSTTQSLEVKEEESNGSTPNTMSESSTDTSIATVVSRRSHRKAEKRCSSKSIDSCDTLWFSNDRIMLYDSDVDMKHRKVEKRISSKSIDSYDMGRDRIMVLDLELTHRRVEKRISSKSIDSADLCMFNRKIMTLDLDLLNAKQHMRLERRISPKLNNFTNILSSIDNITLSVDMKQQDRVEKSLSPVPKCIDSSKSYMVDKMVQTSEGRVEEIDINPTYGKSLTTKSIDSVDEIEIENAEVITSQVSVATNNVESPDTNPKIEKDIKNKISKSDPQKITKTLAAEITDFFKTSASKLKPSCLILPKRDKKKTGTSISEPSYKTTQRLIPRSPYISPTAYEHVTRKSPTNQPPFYAWNKNSKNVVCRQIPTSASCSSIKTKADTKTMKNIENFTRQASYKAYGFVEMDIISDPTQHISRPRKWRSEYNKQRLFVPKKVSDQRSPTQKSPTNLTKSTKNLPTNLTTSAKNLPKISIQLPSPHITLTKVKTQLPCEFPKREKVKTKVNGQKLLKVTFKEPEDKYIKCIKEQLMRKWDSLVQVLCKCSDTELHEGLRSRDKRNTWPPRYYRYSACDLRLDLKNLDNFK